MTVANRRNRFHQIQLFNIQQNLLKRAQRRNIILGRLMLKAYRDDPLRRCDLFTNPAVVDRPVAAVVDVVLECWQLLVLSNIGTFK